MKSFLAQVIALGLAASTAFAQQLTINTPANVVQCEPVQFTWTGGVAPYFLSIVPGATPLAAALLSFPETSANSLTWVPNLQENNLGLALRDSTGATAQSAAFNVATNSVATCSSNTTSFSFGSTGATVPATTGSSPATVTSGTVTTGTTTNIGIVPSTSTSGPGKTSAGSSTSTSSTSTKSAGATRVTGQIAAAGIIGAAMVALLA